MDTEYSKSTLGNSNWKKTNCERENCFHGRATLGMTMCIVLVPQIKSWLRCSWVRQQSPIEAELCWALPSAAALLSADSLSEWKCFQNIFSSPQLPHLPTTRHLGIHSQLWAVAVSSPRPNIALVHTTDGDAGNVSLFSPVDARMASVTRDVGQCPARGAPHTRHTATRDTWHQPGKWSVTRPRASTGPCYVLIWIVTSAVRGCMEWPGVNLVL